MIIGSLPLFVPLMHFAQVSAKRAIALHLGLSDVPLLSKSLTYRRIHHVKFLAFHRNQLEYNGSQGANVAG